MVGERATPEAIESIRKEIGSDKGFAAQYIGYLRLIVSGNFGRSYYSNRDVLDDVSAKIPNTMKLAFAAMAVAIPCGMAIGIVMAYRKGRLAERLCNMITIGGVSLPVFWVGLMAMLIFSLRLRLLPPSGTGGLKFLILPAFVLAVPALSSLARVAASTIEETMGLPYIRTAKAKGLAQMKITMVHVLKNALIPIVTIIGLDFGSYLSGAVVTETHFWLGRHRALHDGGHHHARLSCDNGVHHLMHCLICYSKHAYRYTLSLFRSEDTALCPGQVRVIS